MREADPDGAGETIVLALEAADAVSGSRERAGALIEIVEMALEIATCLLYIGDRAIARIFADLRLRLTTC